MKQTLNDQAKVPDDMHGQRLDSAAAELFDQFSRSRLQQWIKSGELLADGKTLRPRDKVSRGMMLTLNAELEEAGVWEAEDIELDIVFEDEHLLVVNKPAGLVVHPAAGHASGTLVNALLAHHEGLNALPRAGIVHRLDRDTTGLMVVAKSLQAHHHLVQQLQARTVSRQYCALCLGTLTGGGTIDEPMGRHPRQRKKMAVVALGGKSAITHYRIAQRFAHHTQLEVKLETGRTHQIRVHLAHRHHPLIGDPLYGGRPRLPAGASAELIDALRGFPRQALHAQKLGLVHPHSGEDMLFSSALPQDMQSLIAVLQQEDCIDGQLRRD